MNFIVGKQISDERALEVSKELKNKYGIITSPESIKIFILGLELQESWAHSKKEIVQSFLSEVYGYKKSQPNSLKFREYIL